MKRETHNSMTKNLLPWVHSNTINKVNKALDSPDPMLSLGTSLKA
ncbi:MAG: hypothetical protein ACE5J2_04805 [Nitrososphaerales archaeon]